MLYTSLIKFFTGNPLTAAYTFRNYISIWESEGTQLATLNTLLVSGGGALVGAAAGNPVAGAVVGGLGGAAIGAATTPRY